MRALQKQHIVDMLVWVDDSLPKQLPNPAGGRPAKLTTSETVTILLFCSLTAPQKLLKGVWRWALTNHSGDFNLPACSKFVEHCHKALPALCWLLEQTLDSGAELRFMDSTMLPVCKLIRADRHRVAGRIAAFGKNWQGWHYGFKLHASIDHRGRLAALVFTPASEHDNRVEERLANEYTRILVSDSHYGGSIQRKHLWQRFRCLVVAPPHYKQNKQLAAHWQMLLLHMRPKIEATFGKLKEHYFLVTSFPRSVRGYFVHYVRCLLGYQMGVNS